MRIGFFHTTLPERDRKPGGVDVFVYRLAQKLTERGHEVTVFSFSRRPPEAAFEHVQLKPVWVGHSTVTRLFAVPLLVNRLNPPGLDVLHLHGDDWFYLRRKVPTVRTFHGSALFEARHSPRWRRRLGQLAVYPLELLACRLATGSYCVAPGMPAGYRLDGILGPGIDPGRDPAERPHPPSILFVGTWNGRKRGRFLYETFQAHVRPSVPDVELWMVSDAVPFVDEQVRWIASPPDDELNDLYRRAWVLCLPSTYEGFGLPYLEAMAHNTPVVATPNPGSRFVSGDGEAAQLVTDDRLGESLVQLLTDEALRKRLARAGRVRADAFNWDAVLDVHERAYQLAASNSTARAASPRSR
jgi:phosphatidyl-myo-inositol alpha-mannosyltransferase